MVGSDAVLLGEFPSPRTYGCFPVILGKFVRDEGVLSLPQAIRKMTSFPAQRLGLHNRGLLRDGFAADLVVFDPKTVSAPATRAQPKQLAVGIDHVFVNGTQVIDQGVHTGAVRARTRCGAAGASLPTRLGRDLGGSEIRPMLSGAKNSAIGTVRRDAPMNRLRLGPDCHAAR